VGEVSPYAATPRCARVCVYPLRGDTPRRPVQFLPKQDFAVALGAFPLRASYPLSANALYSKSCSVFGTHTVLELAQIPCYYYRKGVNQGAHTVKTKLPIGIDDFAMVSEGDYVYVDKTTLIDELLNNGSHVTLFTRPRRFGKTLNMSMLRYFFDITERERSAALFRGLAIERSPHYARRGTNPVIFLTLKDLDPVDWPTMLESLAIKLARTCEQILAMSDGFSELSKKFLIQGGDRRWSRTELGASLIQLCQILHQHYGKKVILLIDEYDAPLHDAYAEAYYHEAIKFFRVFLGSALKSNPHLEFAALTGVLRVSKESLFSGLNNVRVCSVIDFQFADKFGFTDAEVAALLESQQERLAGISDFDIQALRSWYDGYSFGNSVRLYEIYNPWSVLYAMSSMQLKAHWVNTGQDKLIHDILKRQIMTALPILEKLVNGESIPIQLNDRSVLQSMKQSATLDELWSLLFFSGYLTLATPPDSRNLCEVRMPNKEIRDSYRVSLQSIIEMQTQYYGLPQWLGEDRLKFEFYFKKLLREHPSYHDILSENSVHMFVLGVFIAVGSNRFRATSNREYGDGRPDILIEDDERERGYVFEFKKAKDEADLADAAKRALAQINEKRYSSVLEDKRYQQITKLGVGFFGKKVELAWG